MDLYFYLILGIAAALGTAFAVSIRGIIYHTPDTDNELMAYAAAQSNKWRWPSDVHKYGISKTRMKDMSILLLAIFQKITGDKESDYPYTLLTGISVSICGVLIYIITANYFSPMVGLFAGLLYLFSFWSWQISLYGGHTNIANLFFLLSILMLQRPMTDTAHTTLNFAIAGVLFCFSLFSSPSSYKYSIPFLVAASYTRFILLQQTGVPIYVYSYLSTPITNTVTLFLPLAAIFAWFLLWYKQKWLTVKLYYKKIPKPFDQIIAGQNLFPLEYYFPVMRRKLKTLARIVGAVTVSFLIALNFIGLELFGAILIGFILASLFLTLPNIGQNVRSYFDYLLVSPRKTHFRAYINYYAKRGVVIARNMRGAGLRWLPRMLWRFIPFHFIIFLTSGVYLTASALTNHQINNLTITALLAFVALSPVIWAEITRAPQASRLYSPAFITMMVLISYAAYQAQSLLYKHWYLPVSTLIIVAAWNLFIFIKDIYPARMATRNLLAEITRRKITDIYTYKTSYNSGFVMNIPGLSHSSYLPPKNIKPPFNVHFIESLSDAVDGWIVVPPTSSKNFTMSCEEEAMTDDYTKDPSLNRLLKNRALDQVASVRFPTYGTSRFWVNEDDITSWRSLIRREIKSDDLYRGYGWLIHSSKLKPLTQSAA